MSPEDYETLSLDIQARGIQNPLVVWSCDGRFLVAAGMNRLAIARSQGRTTVPAIVREFPRRAVCQAARPDGQLGTAAPHPWRSGPTSPCNT